MPPGALRPTLTEFLQNVSPDIRDVLIVEVRNASVSALPTLSYGDPHPSNSDYKLVQISPHPEDKDQQIWYWAADREDQDRYNYEISYPFAGLPNYPRIVRTYLVPRAGYLPLDIGTPDPLDLPTEPGDEPDTNKFKGAKLIGERMQRTGDREFDSIYVLVQRVFDNVPSVAEQESYNAEFSYPYSDSKEFPRLTRRYVVPRHEYVRAAQGTQDRIYPSNKLVSDKASRFDDPLMDSAYLNVSRVFDKIPELSDAGDAAALAGFGYSVDRPHGHENYLRVIWKFPMSRADYAPAAAESLCPIAGYTSLILIDEDVADDPSNALTVIGTRIYDTLPGPSLDRVQKDRNATVPGQFISESTTTDSQQRDNTGVLPAVSGLPTDLGGAYLSSSLGPDGANVIVEIEGRRKVEYSLSALAGVEFDSENGVLLPYSQQVVSAGTAGDALDNDGNYAEVRPINPFFSIKTTRKATGLAGNSRTYQQIVNYTWPPVLIALETGLVTAQLDGVEYTERAVYHDIVKDAYSGPCLATIAESWAKDPQTLTVPDQMQPRGIEWDFIFSRGSIQPTLHAEITLIETTGNNHPKYPYQETSETFPATNFTDWPDTLVASASQVPYRGGYKLTTITIAKPV